MARGRRGPLPAAALARRRPGHLDHPLPRRRRRGRGDRGGARRLRAFRPRRARGLDVRPAGDHRPSGAALGVTVLNRLAITIVEALLLGAGLLAGSADAGAHQFRRTVK